MLKNKNKKKRVPLSGKNVYIDKKGRRVFYKASTKQGFIISEDLEVQFKSFSNRYLIGAAAFVIAHFLLFEGNVNILISLAIGLGAFGLCEYKYRKLLEVCPMIQNFDIKNAQRSTKELDQVDKKTLLLRATLYLALAILLIVNIFVTPSVKDNMVSIVLSCAISLFAAYTAMTYGIAISKQK